MGFGQVRRSCFSERFRNYDACRNRATLAFRTTSTANGKVKQSRSQKYTAYHERQALVLCRPKSSGSCKAGNTLQGLGFFIPLLYLPSKSLSSRGSNTALTISSIRIKSRLFAIQFLPSCPPLFSFSTVFGLLFLTTLSDHSVSAYTILAISTIGSAFASILLWGLAASSLAQLISFALVYGFFAGGFTAVYAATAKELAPSHVFARELGWCRHWGYIRSPRCRQRSRQRYLWPIERCTSAR